MNSYELVFILKEESETLLGNIKTAVEETTGLIQSAEKWGKKDFSYLIKKLSSGYYFIWQINLPQDKINDFKKKMDFDENIMRYLLLKSESRNPKQ